MLSTGWNSSDWLHRLCCHYNHAKDSMRRVLYVIGSLNVGGAERHVASICSPLRERGWLPEVLCLVEMGPLADHLISKGIPVHLLRWRERPLKTVQFRVFRLAATFLSCIKFLRAHRPDVIHMFLPGAYVVGTVSALFARVSTRVMSRRSLNDYQNKYMFMRAIEGVLHKRMNLILANSKAVYENLVDEGVPEDKLGLIYNGIDMRLFDASYDREAVRKEFNIPKEALVFLIVANLIEYKGHEDLIRAFSLNKNKMPKDWRLLCVGRDDGIGGRLKQISDSLGLGAYVIWTGSREDVPAIQAASDIGVLCSHEEGFSNAILECMASSLPMVVTNVGGNAEAVIDGVSGLVVPAKDPAALGHALLTLALDPHRARMGNRGRMRVQRDFAIDACVERYDEVYRQLLC